MGGANWICSGLGLPGSLGRVGARGCSGADEIENSTTTTDCEVCRIRVFRGRKLAPGPKI